MFCRCGFEPEAVCTVRVDGKLALWLRLSLVRDGVWSVLVVVPEYLNLTENISLLFGLRPRKRFQNLVRFAGSVLGCRGFLFDDSSQSLGSRLRIG